MSVTLFVTATDTGVGKTVVTAVIARTLLRAGADVAVLKPFATGCERVGGDLVSADGEFLSAAIERRQSPAEICPVRYAEPLAPAVAAESAATAVDFARAAAALRALQLCHEFVIVEGIGGLLVPLAGSFTVADWLEQLHLTSVVVTRPDLGTLNHTCLTVNELRRRGLSIVGLVINQLAAPTDDVAVATNPDWLQRLTSLPVLFGLPHVETPVSVASVDRVAAALDPVVVAAMFDTAD